MSFVRVAKVTDVGPGTIVAVSVEGAEMILYRWRDRFFAAQRRCLHQGADLVNGIVSRGSIICPQHGWRFDAETGVHEMSPLNCLVTYAVSVQGEDILIDPTPIRRAEAIP